MEHIERKETMRYDDLVRYITSANLIGDIDRFYLKHNKSAGVRVRKYMAVVKRMAQKVRNDIQAVKQTIPKREVKSNKRFKINSLKHEGGERKCY